MTSVSDACRRSLVTSASGAPLTTSRSAHVPTATGPWSRAGLRRSMASPQAAPPPSSVLSSRLPSYNPARMARSPA